MTYSEELATVFCRCLGWDGADGEIVSYLASLIKNDDDGSGVDIDELAQLVQGFVPGFSALPHEEQHDRLWNLVEQVRACFYLCANHLAACACSKDRPVNCRFSSSNLMPLSAI